MARSAPRTLSLSLTTTADAAVAFSSSPLWVIDGNFQVATASLDVGAVPERSAALTTYASGTDFGVRFIALHKLLVKPTAAGVHGTLTFFGAVVEDERDLIAAIYGGTA